MTPLPFLYEALGYVLLANRGYSKIRFIERQSSHTPDLIGESESGRALVEVKTVNSSAGDLDFRDVWPPVVRDVGYGLSDKFKRKLDRTIERAALNQLRLYGEPADKRILLLVIELDSSYKFISNNYAEVNEFIATHQHQDVELVHQIIH